MRTVASNGAQSGDLHSAEDAGRYRCRILDAAQRAVLDALHEQLLDRGEEGGVEGDGEVGEAGGATQVADRCAA